MQIAGFLAVLILFFVTYTYIEKLERIECPCAIHPHRDFIKGYSIFAIIYILVTMFIPPDVIFRSLGPAGSLVYVLFKVLFSISMIVFFVITIQYTNQLIRDKCKCSEDARREAIYYWSIIHTALIVILVITNLVLIFLSSAIAVAVSSVKYTSNAAPEMHEVLTDPVGSVKRVPASLKASAKAVSKLISKKRR
jgi:hypothetical protein